MVGVKLTRFGSDVLKLEYVLVGAIDTIRLPPPHLPARGDQLWQHSCFEAFITQGDGAYLEFNFTPSRDWAIYRFEDYRKGMQPALDLPAPDIFVERIGSERFALTAFLDVGRSLVSAQRLGLSAVLEDRSGNMSHWALAHPPEKPDFHHPDCFTFELPAQG